jgi:serine/threonine protein kinase
MNARVNELPEGTIVGTWKVQRLLGRGGQGAVWAVKPMKTKHAPPRALKVCFSDDAKARSRFEREIELMKKCDSPYIGKIYDADTQWLDRVAGVPPFAYLVTERCEGSLEERSRYLGDMRRRPALFREACESVSYLHGLATPIIHRDIKLPNFLLAPKLVCCWRTSASREKPRQARLRQQTRLSGVSSSARPRS